MPNGQRQETVEVSEELQHHRFIVVRNGLHLRQANGMFMAIAPRRRNTRTACSVRMCSSKCANVWGMKPCNRPENIQHAQLG
jgi:hypothetical protein